MLEKSKKSKILPICLLVCLLICGIVIGMMISGSMLNTDKSSVSATPSEELTESAVMLDGGQTIELVINQPSDVKVQAQQGVKETEVTWVQLDQLKTYNQGFRQNFDEIFNINIITQGGIGSKSGCLYVDSNNMHEGNSTLQMAFQNGVFRSKYWSDTKVQNSIAALASQAYNDIDSNSPYALQASINAYYNLLNDSDNPDSFNPTQSVTREEFYTALYKAINPVDENLSGSGNLGNTGYSKFVSQLQDSGYLTVENGSLNSSNLQSPISRAEAIYLLVSYGVYENTCKIKVEDGALKGYAKNVSFKLSDATDGGDMEGHYNGASMSEMYTLGSMLKNPNGGVDEDIYYALGIAQSKGIISSETRWDESLTRSEAIDLIVGLFETYNTTSTAEYGTMDANKYVETESNPGNLADTNFEVKLTLNDLSKTQLDYFKSIVELEKPSEYVQAIINSGEYTYEKESVSKMTIREKVDIYVSHTGYGSLANTAKEYILLGMLPSNGQELFVEWFKAQDKYDECIKLVDDAYKAYEKAQTATPSTSETQKPVETQPVQTEEQNLNLTRYVTVNVKARKAPDQNAEYTGVINSGNKVIVNSIEGNWCKCTWNSLTVYISSDYLSEVQPEVSSQTTPSVTQSPNYSEAQKNTQSKYLGGYASTEGLVTPDGQTLGAYGGSYGYNVSTGAFGPYGDITTDNYAYDMYVANSYLPAAGTFGEAERNNNTHVLLDAQMDALKGAISDEDYVRLESEVEYAFTKGWVQQAQCRVFIAALPDGRYVCNVGPKNTVLWTDPEDPQCYMMYDQLGVLSSVVDWDDNGPYAGAYAKEEYVALGLTVTHPQCIKWMYETCGILKPGSQFVWEEGVVMLGN